jgi:hypothetical protein
MDIIYEVPGTFRITLMREFSPHMGSNRVIKRRTPFVLHLRIPCVEAVENVELTEELFGLLLRLPSEDAFALQKHLHPDFAMSESMMAQIVKAPKALLDYLVQPTNKLAVLS